MRVCSGCKEKTGPRGCYNPNGQVLREKEGEIEGISIAIKTIKVVG